MRILLLALAMVLVAQLVDGRLLSRRFRDRNEPELSSTIAQHSMTVATAASEIMHTDKSYDEEFGILSEEHSGFDKHFAQSWYEDLPLPPLIENSTPVSAQSFRNTDALSPEHRRLQTQFICSVLTGCCGGNPIITFAPSVTSIGADAFRGCTSLIEVTIPDTITTIGQYAFTGSSNITTLTIGSGVTRIGFGACQFCSALVSLTISNGVAIIGGYAFDACPSLTTVIIPSSVTTLDESAFGNCAKLSSISIGSGVTSVGQAAFYGNSLTAITIPSNVLTIGQGAFSKCVLLSRVTILSSSSSLLSSSGVFDGASGLSCLEGIATQIPYTCAGCASSSLGQCTSQPTTTPSSRPTTTPSRRPTAPPSLVPTTDPTATPSVTPSLAPTTSPTKTPSFAPSGQPTAVPTSQPTLQPAPQVMNAKFDGNGLGFSILFDQPTDRGGLPDGDWLCSELLEFGSASLSECSWVDDSLISVDLGTSGGVDVNTTITLKDSPPIRRQCAANNCDLHLTSSRQSFTVLPPMDAEYPVLDVRIADTIGPCGDIVIDAISSYGSVGQPWMFLEWTVSGTGSSNFSAIQSNLSERKHLSSPIVLSNTLFTMGELSFSLTVRNIFGLSASVTRVVSVTGDRNRPLVSIASQPSIRMKARDQLFLQGFGSISLCSDSPMLAYSWSVYDRDLQTSIRSSSLDSRAFKAQAYAFTPGRNYTVTLTASTAGSNSSASVLVIIESGKVVARIRGSATRDARWDQDLEFDASGSYDENFGTSLRCSWSCSNRDTGDGCRSLLPESNGGPSLTVNSTILLLGNVLEFTVKCEASDNRSSTANVTVNVIPRFAPLVTLSQSSFVVSPGHPLTIGAYIYGNFSCSARWEVSQELKEAAVTPLFRDFSQRECVQNIAFSLGLSTSGFIGGSTYSFTLSVISAEGSANGTVTVDVRQGPSLGSLVVTPETGFGLETLFFLSSPGWFAASDAYPLSYEYGYSLLGNQSTGVKVQLRVTKAFAMTVLPAALSESNNMVFTLLQVFDAYDASSSASKAVQVLSRDYSYEDLFARLDSDLTTASDSSDLDSILRNVNVVASTVTVLRCSNAPDCAVLSRTSCAGSGVPNTCGPCLPFSFGIEGASNLPCLATAALQLGDPCSQDAQCAYGVCSFGKCVDSEKALSCSSAVQGSICSGHGSCRFADAYLVAVDRCMFSDRFCEATCVCESEYGGADCGIRRFVRSSAINATCTYMKILANSLDSSISVVSALAGSLQQSFTDDELSSAPIAEVCIEALTSISTVLQSTIDLSDAGIVTLGQLLDVLSKLSTAVGRLTRQSNSTFESSAFTSRLDSATRDIADSALSRMAPGQTLVRLPSKSVDMSLHNHLLSTSAGLNFSASGASNAATIMFDSVNGLEDCVTFRGGYASFAISETSVIRYQNSESVTSGLVTWYSPEISGSDSYERSVSERGKSSFMLQIPFTRPQMFYAKTTSRFSNVTFPNCAVRQDEQYIPCDCELHNYNDYSATFSCSSPSASVCPREDSRSSGGNSRVNSVEKQFGTVATSLLRIFKSTLNPASVDWRSAGPVFALFFFLLAVFLGGIVYFRRWDNLDRRIIAYGLASRSERQNRLRSRPDADLFVIRERYDELFRSGGEIDVGSLQFQGEDVELDRRWMKTNSWATHFFAFIRSVRKSGSSLLESSDPGYRFMQCLLRFHPFLWSFTGASVTTTRTIRFVSLFKSFIVSLFVSSLIYRVYFPIENDCDGITSIYDCLKEPSALSSGTLCMWEADDIGGTCSLRPPPTDFGFLVVVAIISSMISLPLDVVVSLLLLLVCNKKPNWNEIFLSSTDNTNADDARRNGDDVEEDQETKALREDQHAADFVLGSLRALKCHAETTKDSLLRAQYQFTLDTFLNRLGLHFIGYDVFLNNSSRCFFSDANEALKYHVKRTRLKGQKILSEIERFSYLGTDADEIKGDKLLLHFTYEQIGFFRTKVIQPHLDKTFTPEPPMIHPLVWVAGWLVVIGVNFFFIVWALLWGLQSNAFTFRNWIANFVLETAWGCFVSTIARILVLNFLLLSMVRPSIVKTIKNVCDTVGDLDMYEDENDATYLGRTLSPVCYAASRMKGSDKRLKAVYLLKRLNDNDHSQIKAEGGPEYQRKPRVLRDGRGGEQLRSEFMYENVVISAGEECEV